MAKGEDLRARLSVRNRTSSMDRRLSFSSREGAVAVPPMIASRLPGKGRCGRAATSASAQVRRKRHGMSWPRVGLRELCSLVLLDWGPGQASKS